MSIMPTNYIRIGSLRPEQREAFAAWIEHRTWPVVPRELDANGQPAPCAYAWDYARWLAEGRPSASVDPLDT